MGACVAHNHTRPNNGVKLQENILLGISCDQRRAQQKAVDWEPIRKEGDGWSWWVRECGKAG